MSKASLFNYIGSGGQVSTLTTGIFSPRSLARGSHVYGGYMTGGRTNGDADNQNKVRFLDFNTDTVNNLFTRLANFVPYRDNSATLKQTLWRHAACSNYRVKAYVLGGWYYSQSPQADSNIVQANDFHTTVWYQVATAVLRTYRPQNWGTTNPGTAGYIMGGYISQNQTWGANSVEKISYSTEVMSQATTWTGNFGVTDSTVHNGTTALYQMGGSVGQAGGYGDTARINKLVFSTDTGSTLSATISDSRDLHSGTQSGASGAAYSMNGRGGNGTAIDKMPFSTETCSVLASGHSYSVGNGLTANFANHGTAIYSAMGDSASAAPHVDKWTTSNDTRSALGSLLDTTTSAEAQGYANTSTN